MKTAALLLVTLLACVYSPLAHAHYSFNDLTREGNDTSKNASAVAAPVKLPARIEKLEPSNSSDAVDDHARPCDLPSSANTTDVAVASSSWDCDGTFAINVDADVRMDPSADNEEEGDDDDDAIESRAIDGSRVGDAGYDADGLPLYH